MRKFLIISAIVFSALTGLWVYCLVGAPPWISKFARGVTRDSAHAIGMKAFEEDAEQAAGAQPKETVANLPQGYYVYVGERPAQAAPKWVVVNPGGTISWLNLGATSPVVSTVATKPATNSKPAASSGATKSAVNVSDKDSQIEEYDYPKIKFRPKPLAEGNGAIAQLFTTYERGGGDGSSGVVKYRLTLFKASSNQTHEVQLLDSNGFKLVQFNASDFHEIPESQLMEARDSFPCDEEEYRQARDYSIR